MPIRIPTGKITLNRNGQRVYARAGEPFEFTAEEIANIREINPDALRKPRVEAPEAVQTQIERALETNAAQLGNLAAGVTPADDKAKSNDNPAGGETPAAGSARGNAGGKGKGGKDKPEPAPAPAPAIDDDSEL